MSQVQVKSPMYYFGSFLIQKNKEDTLLYSTTFQDHFKIVRALPKETKSMKHFTDQILKW